MSVSSEVSWTGPRSRLMERDQTWDAIVAAARRCFTRLGPADTTMAHVAEEAGMHRRALYRIFSGRRELVEAAIVVRIEELLAILDDEWARHLTFEEAFVETSVATIDLARNDEEFRSLLSAGSDTDLHFVMAGPYPPVSRLMDAVWIPRLARAHAEAKLRTDVTDQQLIEWIRGVYLLLMLRTDLSTDPDAERAIVRNFLLPSIMYSPLHNSRTDQL